MKVVFKIAITELRTLFYSPIAWLLMIVFMIQCGGEYFSVLSMVAKQQEISIGGRGMFYSHLTDFVFLSNFGMFQQVMRNLYLYIPLLTMGLVSREISGGTIKLLYSSPISVSQIVFGKYMGMIGYSLILVAVMVVFVVAGTFHIKEPQIYMLLSAMVGFFLLLCAYSAIGLFMSCLTGYQVVAALSTFVMIGLLSYLGEVWQRVAFVREMTYYLSINGRTETMLRGLITSKDVIYFVVIVYIFLGLSIYRLKAGMESVSGIVKAGRYAAIVGSALLVGYVSSIPGLIAYWDVTFGDTRTLTPKVQEILADFGEEPVEITAYANLLDGTFHLGSPGTYKANQERWESFRRFKTDISLNTVMYYDSVTIDEGRMGDPGKNPTLKQLGEQYAKAMDIDLEDVVAPEEIRKRIDLSEEKNRYVMQLMWRHRTTKLRVFDDMMMWPSETEVAAAFLRLQQANLPTIAFIKGDLERDINTLGDRDYKALTNLPTFRYSLINQGFDVVDISLDREDIPESITAVVLADPRVDLSQTAVEKIRKYIQEGKNIMIAGEPTKPGKVNTLKPILDELSVAMDNGMIIQEGLVNAPNFVEAVVNKQMQEVFKPLGEAIADSAKLTMPGVAALNYTGDDRFTVQVFATTEKYKTWNRIRPLNLDVVTRAVAKETRSEDGRKILVEGKKAAIQDTVGTVTFSQAQGDVAGPLTTVLGLTRTVKGKWQRIIVAGDADFLSNMELSRRGTANFMFSTSLFSWMSYGKFPVDTSRPTAKDTGVKITMDDLRFQRIILQWIIPGIFLACGTVILIRRKRK
ncbi:Gldg family protein [Chryseolinea soli]|uniref:ABC transporter n=1 Tax=Chryseolinea soli TaxID=2321403 RepID=A0A385SL48_9BACT|nr:Gldg family protein [Chryseolinea soli]AYB31969.1 ABC transporter [Chryseolinea soli]